MKLLKRTDFIVLLAIAAAALIIWGVTSLAPSVPAHAELYHGNTLLKAVALNTGRDELFCLPQYPQVQFRLFADGSIAFESSDCPDKVCVRSGRLSRAGQSAACLPNRLILKIVADGDTSGPDIIVG